MKDWCCCCWVQTSTQRAPRPPVVPQPPFHAPAVRDPRPSAPSAAATAWGPASAAAAASLVGGDRAGLRGPAAAAAALERDGIETVTVTNVVSAAPAINKIGSLFTSLNKTVTGALNSIITGQPVLRQGRERGREVET